jgi:hypothetical protein
MSAVNIRPVIRPFFLTVNNARHKDRTGAFAPKRLTYGYIDIIIYRVGGYPRK